MAKDANKTEEAQAAPAAGVAGASWATFDLNGRYRFKVDDKGRVSLPAKFRKVVSKDLVVTESPLNGSLWVFESEGFNKWIDQVFIDRFGRYDASSTQHMSLRTTLKSRAEDVQMDASGRIMLPAEMRGAADISKDVVIVGNTGYFEVWDAKRYDQMNQEADLSLLFH